MQKMKTICHNQSPHFMIIAAITTLLLSDYTCHLSGWRIFSQHMCNQWSVTFDSMKNTVLVNTVLLFLYNCDYYVLAKSSLTLVLLMTAYEISTDNLDFGRLIELCRGTRAPLLFVLISMRTIGLIWESKITD